jgi:hypothetical protein
VFIAECRQRRDGLEVLRTADAFTRIESPQEGASQLNRVLAQAGIKRAHVALAVRGFGLVHHHLTFPPATDAVLGSIVDREMRRLEPDLADPVTAWIRLPPEGTDEPEQAQVLAAAIARDVVTAMERSLEAAGHTLEHFTALPAAMHRLAEEFLPVSETTALVAQLPDGPFLGFSVAGAVRLIIEPPVPAEDPLPDSTAVAEETELGAVFVRQQFHGELVAKATLVASPESYTELEEAIGTRLGIPVSRLAVQDLNAGAIAAVGAVLDARAQRSVALGGNTVREAKMTSPALQLGATASLAIAALVGLWAVLGAWDARRLASDLRVARAAIDNESRRLIPATETAEQRKLVRDAMTAIEGAAGDRNALLRGLTSVADAVTGPIRIDSILVSRGGTGWRTGIGGTVFGATSGHAVQALNDFYRALPRRIAVDSLALEHMFYVDTLGGSVVHFQITFGLAGRKTN